MLHVFSSREGWVRKYTVGARCENDKHAIPNQGIMGSLPGSARGESDRQDRITTMSDGHVVLK